MCLTWASIPWDRSPSRCASHVVQRVSENVSFVHMCEPCRAAELTAHLSGVVEAVCLMRCMPVKRKEKKQKAKLPAFCADSYRWKRKTCSTSCQGCFLRELQVSFTLLQLSWLCRDVSHTWHHVGFCQRSWGLAQVSGLCLSFTKVCLCTTL